MRFLAGLLALAVLVGVGIWTALQPPPPLRSATVEFHLEDVTAIIPGVARWEHATVTVRDERIARVALPKPLEETPPSESPYAGHFVLPGLIDLHTHLPPANALRLTPYFALLYLSAGVTTVRDAGDVDGTAVAAARRGIDGGRFPGPRIFACGPFIGGGPPRWPDTVTLSGPEQAGEVVADLARRGFDCVKAYEDLSAEEIAALVDAAREHGLSVIGHVPAKLSLEEAGVPEVQHFLGVPRPESLARDHLWDRLADWGSVDDARLGEVVDATVAQGIVHTPTLVGTAGLLGLEDPERAFEAHPRTRLLPRMIREVAWSPQHGFRHYRGLRPEQFAQLRDALAKRETLLGRLHRAGAQLQIGTDAPGPFVVPGWSVHDEMRRFVAAGLDAEEVWAIATWRAGRVLGQPLLGTLQAGAPADLLVFREDPTRDLAGLDTLEAVVADGRLYPRAAIDAKVEAYREHFEGTLVDALSVAMARWMVPRLALRDH